MLRRPFGRLPGSVHSDRRLRFIEIQTGNVSGRNHGASHGWFLPFPKALKNPGKTKSAVGVSTYSAFAVSGMQYTAPRRLCQHLFEIFAVSQSVSFCFSIFL